MKKYILILVTAISFGQASNQMVTFTQAQSLGFSLKSGQSHVTINQCMTKSDALTKYNLDANAMSSYSSNQLVPKSAWVSGIVGVPFTTNFNYYNSSSQVCSSPPPVGATYYTISGLKIGARVYSDQSCTSQVVNQANLWFSAMEDGKKIAWFLKSDLTVEFSVVCL